MINLASSYNPNIFWSVGPDLLAQTACKMKNVSVVEELLDAPSPLVPIVQKDRFEPFTFEEITSVCFSEAPISFAYWKHRLENSSAIHFSGYALNFAATDPKYHLHALLGPRYCPISFSSTAHF